MTADWLRLCTALGTMVVMLGVALAPHANASDSMSHTSSSGARETVVLLHGLARSGRSMKKMAKALEAAGYDTCIVDYPSTEYPLEQLVEEHVIGEIRRCVPERAPLHFVTHSMGGIVVRYLAREQLVPEIGRVVMLSPPNSGSEVVDRLGAWQLFKRINGPAGSQLSTDTDSLPNTLGPATFDVGVITGKRSVNWILSSMIEGDDDGKVSIERARLAGMNDFLVIAATHPFIMKNRTAIRQTLAYLHNGQFDRPAGEQD